MRNVRSISTAVIAAGMLLAPAVLAGGPSPLYALSDFGGVTSYSAMARMCADRARDEIYVLESNVVRIYNASGMEVFWFGYEPSLGSVQDIAVDGSGDLFFLSYAAVKAGQWQAFIARCNYRGEFLERIELKEIPRSLEGFRPNVLAISQGRFVLASGSQLLAAAFGRDGRFERQWDLAALGGVQEKDRGNAELGGFSVDPDGNLLFTIPVLFKAYVAAPDGTAQAFGRPGSGAGMFGIVGGIVRGDDGRIWVADRLRGVVMAFGSDLRLEVEVTSDVTGRDLLAGPTNVLIGAGGKLYVTQTRGRGISVFATRPS